MIVSDLDRRTYCAITFRNGGTWDVVGNNRYPDPITVRDNQKVKWPYTISGSIFQFDFVNPKGGDWTSNDMIVGWGLD